jgi:hypothetical protein
MLKSAFHALAAAGLLVAAPAVAQQKVPVTFAKGASSATLKGSIKGEQFRDYTVNARAGQTLTVNMSNPDGRAFFNVMAPGSTGEAVYVGSTEGDSFRGPVPGTGATTIRVYQMRATGRRGEVANYALTIGVGGAAASTDAKVPGTGYNATAQIRCVAEPNKPMSACKAGVKRSSNGGGTVHVTTPDGGSRVITFAGGKAVRSDSQAGMDVQRRGDTSVVRIGTVEVYEIPDAFIFGG